MTIFARMKSDGESVTADLHARTHTFVNACTRGYTCEHLHIPSATIALILAGEEIRDKSKRQRLTSNEGNLDKKNFVVLFII